MRKILTLFILSLVVFNGTLCLSACNSDNKITSPPIGESTQTLPSNDEIATPLIPITPPESSSGKIENKENTPSQELEYASYLSSNTNNLNVRSSSSTSGKKLGSINKGDMLSYEGMEGNWYRTVFKEQTAYVHKDYVTIIKIKKTSESVEKVINVGLSLLGHPYVYGSERYHWGNGKLNYNFVPGKFDCSALMQYVFYFGSDTLLEVTSKKQFYQGTDVDELKRGDLMFFTNANGYNASGINRVRHVGMYLGDNYILHTASDYAVIEPISTKRWEYFITARRILD